MSLDILDHPTVVRLLEGEPVRVEEMRQALVDFWKENGTFEICRSCRDENLIGCCGACRWHTLEQGCTKRNLGCLSFTCMDLQRHLRSLGLWEGFYYLQNLLREGHSAFGDAIFNHSRLPDHARLYVGVSRYEEPGIICDHEPVRSAEDQHLSIKSFQQKAARARKMLLEARKSQTANQGGNRS